MPARFARTASVKRKIVKLRAKGHNSPEIAKRLGEKVRFIEYLISQLIAEGKIVRSATRRPPSTFKRQNEDIVALRTGNLSNRTIASSVGLKPETLHYRLRPLLKSGSVKRRGLGKVAILASRNLSFWRDRDDPQLAWFVEKINNRVPYEIIGRTLNCTVARVGQICKLIEQHHGREIFADRERIVGLAEFAREIGRPYKELHKLCREGVIKYTQREPGSRFLISREECEAFKLRLNQPTETESVPA